jgi:hypothetical protein
MTKRSIGIAMIGGSAAVAGDWTVSNLGFGGLYGPASFAIPAVGLLIGVVLLVLSRRAQA